MRGKTNTAEDTPSSQGIDLDVAPTTPPSLVIVGSSTTATGAEWAAAVFNDLEAPVPNMGYGDLTVPFSSGSGALVAVSASSNGTLAAAGSLLITSPNAELSFGATRLVVDAEKECDLAMEVVKPLEVSFVGGRTASVTLRASNKGTKVCSGRMTVPAPYRLGAGAVDTGTIVPGGAFTTDVTLGYDGGRRATDVLAFDLAAGGDADTSNNQRIVSVAFSYCDLRLLPASGLDALPSEGSVARGLLGAQHRHGAVSLVVDRRRVGRPAGGRRRPLHGGAGPQRVRRGAGLRARGREGRQAREHRPRGALDVRERARQRLGDAAAAGRRRR